MPSQNVNINFSQGLNTKTDEWQLPPGQFLSLQNSVFQKGGLLQKRNGYAELVSIPSSYITTLNNNLLSIGSTISAYSSSLDEVITKGTLEPCSLNVLPLIRNNANQNQSDTVVANGLVLTTYTQSPASGVNQYLFAIADVVTGQNIVQPTAIPPLSTGAISGSSRVFVVGAFFVIVSQVLIGGSTFLQYVSIPVSNPVNLTTNAANVSAAQNTYPETYSPVSSNPGWDAVVVDDNLVIAYNSTAGAQGVHVTSLTQGQIGSNSASAIVHTFNNAAYIGAIVSVCVDTTVNPNIIYISFWNNSTQNGYTCAVFIGFGSITTKFSPQQIITTTAVLNLASAAQNNSCLVFSEVSNNYSYDSGVPTHFINAVTVSSTGTVGTPYVAIRSVGLASKAFIVSSRVYFLAAYQSPFQPTFFLMNGSTTTAAAPIVVAKLAYQNGGGYVTLGLPSVTVDGEDASLSYRFKDLVQALNTQNNTQQTAVGGIYSQTGLNLVTFTIGTTVIDTSEIANSLHISGGHLSMFDGYLPVEHNFFLFPDSVEATWSATGGAIHAQPDGATNTNAYSYQVTYEWTDNNGLAYRSAPSIPIFVTTTGNGTAGSITVNVPYLRLTSKIANPVKIVIYRWSVANQVYNQITSIVSPVLNSTTSDSVAYVDTLADASIVGNSILYTTGGVVPDTNGPASDIITLFDTRLWVVPSEDPNTLWVSKTVIEATPVEMSSVFTIFVAPNIGTTGSSGPITAIAPMDDKLIIFKKNAMFYINGTGPDNLGSTSVGSPLGQYSQPIFITAVAGCTNQRSIVLTQNGLMFQSDKGIWMLGRDLQTTYIGAPVEAYNASNVTSSQVIPKTNRVVFTLDTGGALMYDYFYGQWGTFTGFTGISSCIYNGFHTVLNPYSQVLQETPGRYVDAGNPVLMQFATGWLNLASLQGYERFYGFTMLARYLSPHKIIVGTAYDYNPSTFHTSTIRPRNFSPSDPSPFGITTPFGSPTPLEQWQVAAKRQLCQSFQLSIQEVFDPSLGTDPGAGFTMSGINAEILIKKATRPIKGANSVG